LIDYRFALVQSKQAPNDKPVRIVW